MMHKRLSFWEMITICKFARIMSIPFRQLQAIWVCLSRYTGMQAQPI
uniref:Uncharacterized protein n=1 Tax=Manihot esculenta TaxID=3983 RepID=A0A2C9UJV2_MANES